MHEVADEELLHDQRLDKILGGDNMTSGTHFVLHSVEVLTHEVFVNRAWEARSLRCVESRVLRGQTNNVGIDNINLMCPDCII